MTTYVNNCVRGLIVLAAVSAIGCGQGFKSGSSASGNSAASTIANIDDQLAKANQAAKDAQTAMGEAQDAIDQITDANGNINISLFTKSSSSQVQSSGLLAPLVAKLQPLFDNVFNKVNMVEQQFAAARLALADALGKLNQNDPAQAALVAKVQAQLAQIDALEASFRDKVHALAGKLTLAITGLDKIINGVTSFIPGFGWLASWALDMFVMDDVKNLILDLQTKLLAI
jgi:hypothetical protein